MQSQLTSWLDAPFLPRKALNFILKMYFQKQNTKESREQECSEEGARVKRCHCLMYLGRGAESQQQSRRAGKTGRAGVLPLPNVFGQSGREREQQSRIVGESGSAEESGGVLPMPNVFGQYLSSRNY